MVDGEVLYLMGEKKRKETDRLYGKEWRKNMRIVVATSNQDKMKEFREILVDVDWEVQSMGDVGITLEIEENGATFEENAMIKAKALAQEFKKIGKEAIVIADDSGLEVDYLGGQPGVHSARFMGRDTSYEVKNQAILDKLEGVEGEARSARFVCAIAAVMPDGTALLTRGTIEGQIAEHPEGENGFGYDPIVYLPAYHTTTAGLSREEKNRISHRGEALRMMREEIRKRIV